MYACLFIVRESGCAQTARRRRHATTHAKPARPRARCASDVRDVTIQVTDAAGAPLADTTVTTMAGVVSREGVTGGRWLAALANMRPGTYRLRFAREGSITLERELTLRAGESRRSTSH